VFRKRGVARIARGPVALYARFLILDSGEKTRAVTRLLDTYQRDSVIRPVPSSLLASGKDGNGRKLIEQSRQSLMGIGSRLQLTLLALGMTSRELSDILKSF
jgi:hypothetical protein